MRSASAATVAEIERLYADGSSTREIGRAFDLSQTTVRRLLRRHGIPVRPRGGNAKYGPAHHAWKGDAAGYVSCHSRVRTRRGMPQRCEVCGTADPSKAYDWANLTGNYPDPDDYKRMCRSCHARFDDARRRAAISCP